MSKHDAEFKRLMRGMKKLPTNVQKNIMNGSTRAAAVVMKKEAKANAPENEGDLKKAITVRKRRTKYKTQTLYIVAVMFGKNSKYDAFYASMIEFGTMYFTAKPFMRPAFDNNWRSSVTVAREYIKKRLPKEIRKMKVGR